MAGRTTPKLYPPAKNYIRPTSSGDNLKFTKLRALNSQPVRVKENNKLSHVGPAKDNHQSLSSLSLRTGQPLCNERSFYIKPYICSGSRQEN